MARNKIISFLFIYFTGICGQPLKAQLLNIHHDTIFVNMEAEVQIIFPSPPTTYSTVPDSTQYHIWDVKTGIYLVPRWADSTPATLLLSEGGREHKFILVFKQDIPYNEAKLYYDYSTVNKLAQHISDRDAGAPAVQQKITTIAEAVKNDSKKKIKQIVPGRPADSSSNYYSLLEKGEKEFRLQNYQAAFLDFNKAHNIRPEDPFPVQRLEELKLRLQEKESPPSSDTSRKYLAIIAGANELFDQKKYTVAREDYKKALELKPGDKYTIQQLETIDNILVKGNLQREKVKDEKAAEEKLTTENNYDIVIKAADKFFKDKKYDTAKVFYDRALTLFRRDWPAEQVNEINKILNKQAARAIKDKQDPAQQLNAGSKPKSDSVLTEAELKKNYNLALANARSWYIKNDLTNAKMFYEEAARLQPLQQEPINQLKIINKKVEDIARENEINDNYERDIILADSLVIAKDYESAVDPYRHASTIKPLESYPKKQLKYIQSEISLAEKRKKEEKERRFNDVLTLADKAVAGRNYDEAKARYSEALAIHPENEYAKRRLDIISYQVEKAREEKPLQDSVKEVVPVKKSKRKKTS